MIIFNIFSTALTSNVRRIFTANAVVSNAANALRVVVNVVCATVAVKLRASARNVVRTNASNSARATAANTFLTNLKRLSGSFALWWFVKLRFGQTRPRSVSDYPFAI